ncbi:MAG: DUF4340 domain-containing protein [Zavarzinella sp.]
MNFRTTYILAGVVGVGLLVLLLVLLFSGGNGDAPPEVEGYLLQSFRAARIEPEQIQSVEIERPGGKPAKLTFARSATGWRISEPANSRADAARLEKIIQSLLEAKTDNSADISPDLGKHGLSSPGLTITLKTKDNLKTSVSLGNVSIGGDRSVVYVTVADDAKKAKAVRRSALVALFQDELPKTATTAAEILASMDSFREREMLGAGMIEPSAEIKSLRIRQDSQEVAIFRVAPSTWQFRLPANYGAVEIDAPLDARRGEAQVNSLRVLLNQIRAIRPGDGSAFIDDIANLGNYGLAVGKDSMLQIDLTRENGDQETLYVGKQVDKPGTDRFYARFEGDSVIAEVNASAVRAVKSVLKEPNLIRNRTFIRINPLQVDALDITLGAETFSLRRLNDIWKLYDAAGRSLNADSSAVTKLIDRLANKSLISGFPADGLPDEKKGFAAPAAQVKVWEMGIATFKPDPMKPDVMPTTSKDPTATVLLGEIDTGEVVHARRLVAGAQQDVYLPVDVLRLATRPRLEYIQATIPTLNVNDVVGMKVFQGAVLQSDVSRQSNGEAASVTKWTLSLPENVKDRVADSITIAETLNALSALKPAKVVADQQTDELLQQLNLTADNPATRIVVTMKDMTEREYLFGKETTMPPGNVYFKSNDGVLLLEVSKAAIDILGTKPLVNKTIHRFEPAKAKSLTIKGWASFSGTPIMQELVKDGADWKFKTQGNFTLDNDKVNQLVDSICGLRALTFEVIGTGPTPEQKLDVQKDALEFTLELESGPVVLTISPPVKEGKLYATSSTIPGDVVLISDRFVEIRKAPAALKKD